MDFKIEGANHETEQKIKGSEAKLLAKGRAKMPHATMFKVKMRPNLVNASSGSFFGGHLYGSEDGSKWLKCAEVRIKHSGERAVTEQRKEEGAAKQGEEGKKRGGKEEILVNFLKHKEVEVAEQLKQHGLSSYNARNLFSTHIDVGGKKYISLSQLFKPGHIKDLSFKISRNAGGGSSPDKISLSISVDIFAPFIDHEAEELLKKHVSSVQRLTREVSPSILNGNYISSVFTDLKKMHGFGSRTIGHPHFHFGDPKTISLSGDGLILKFSDKYSFTVDMK